MLLNAQMYEQIVRSLRSDVRTIQDRRRHPRVGLRARVNIVPLDKDRQPREPACVWVRDVSAGGFGLVVREPLELGQLLIVRLDRRDNDPLSLLCDIVQNYSTDRVGSRILRTLKQMKGLSHGSEGAIDTSTVCAPVLAAR